ncbi:MAG: type II toxin-antitoxin system PemK/MazF family toxin [Thaumarchaeota archaeon]|nr:type II toxin-antitoxin system PemK/MazF family toxin [Nitrososphaerota archaeon]
MVSQRDIVLLSFPFSDLKSSKVRPALVLSNNEYNRKFEDFIAVPLTTNLKSRDYSVLVSNRDLESGRLIVDSNIKVDRIFSVSKKLVRMNIGRINRDIHSRIKKIIVELIE